MTGKNKCKILKEIRSKIAKENDIPFITKECTYQGQCKGTCPKCEQELVYLEQQLAKRRQLGKMVTVSALALGMTLGSVGCQPQIEVLEGDVPYYEEPEVTSTSPDPNLRPSILQEGIVSFATEGYPDEEYESNTEEVEMLEGDVAWTEEVIGELPEEDLVMGMIALPTEETDGE